jgi:two-component system chemotaxis response regulator CheB
MGADGKDGALSVKEHGGVMLIQEEKSCVVYGMPKAVYTAGAFDRIETPDGIISILQEKVSGIPLKREVL